MAFANVSYTANGAVQTFVVPFGYLQQSHVKVFLDDVQTILYTFNGSGDIVMDAIPADGVVVKIQRDSDITQKLVAFADGSNLTEEDLNDDASQGIYLQQETRDEIEIINALNQALIAELETSNTAIGDNSTAIVSKVDGAGSSTDNSIPRYDGTTGTILQDSGVTISDEGDLEGINTISVEQITATRTSEANGDNPFTLSVDAAGFQDINVLEIDYTTGDITDDANEAVIKAEIDDTLALGGTINALEVSSVAGVADCFGIMAGNNVSPIAQASTQFLNPTSAKVNGVDTFMDLIDDSVSTPCFVVKGDTITTGSMVKFTSLKFDFVDASYSGNLTPTFWYSDGSGGFIRFYPTDGTSGLRGSGIISWDITDTPLWGRDVNNEYTIRVNHSRNAVKPTRYMKQVQVQGIVSYNWTEMGDITANSIQLDSGVRANVILDEGDMSSDRSDALATQRSIKEYVEANAGGASEVTQIELDLKANAIDFAFGYQNINVTTAQKNALTASAGLQVFDTDLGKLQVYDGSTWISLH